ncbi:PREDICTED: uncharacterized protein LOC105558787 [Vollenhovia emeryi]|uniref:uncharacterized protein LOC105558787 n=1 Tax=Vollenhovia emeryi TaxID=411798 RepID=UPI0005F4CE02|nr:PREDICTED: uncharacterized protein LOC105558787 [Vollenhovia emeryi]XP_011862085.1 PREDICTED: uncharacterized protein LOC105558787 [Vollenhovia emeryi]
MSETSGDNGKYKWTPESTALLVSVWSDRQVQKQLEYAPRPQVIWESVARYMKKKGYNVSGKQCRSRMKQVLVCYREAKRVGTRAGVEQYYETIDRVLKNKRIDNVNVGVDTVDATVKSPPKDMKTNKNLQMRLKAQEPVQSLFRTEALSPTWTMGYENEYPDSPESNETIIAKPYRVFSPTRDVAINTGERFIQIGNRAVQTNPIVIEKPIREDYRQNLLAPVPYAEIPFQNAVQNVQNQIIQENMQQYQNTQQQSYTGWNQLPQQAVPANNRLNFQQNVRNLNQQYLPNGTAQNNVMQNPGAENIGRQQNQLHRGALYADNQAMPQEPRKVTYAQNLTATYRQYQDVAPRFACMANGSLSPDYSPDVSQNLNDAFCLSKNDDKTHNLNETYSRPVHADNPADATVVTNNATCNDDSLLLEFLLDSPTPSENGGKSRNSAVNTDEVPSAPLRKKKAQKLEQLMLNAINSQNEVVNKILAAQNDMVSRFLDVDRDRQNRLENRLDHLLNVVHATVLNKNETPPSPPTPPPMPETAITSLLPPPRPGMIPPKLDLVPPKPCRVPCTMPNSNVELVNQNPIITRPGVVSPTNPGGRKLGTIWSKLGPVSTSPFVKAQQRLGFQPVFNNDVRTKSSAERRIIREIGGLRMDMRSLIYETAKLLEAERGLEEKIENARLELDMGEMLTARRKLFTQREPTPIMILTAAFLDTECAVYEQDPPYHGTWDSRKKAFKYARRDNLLAGQGESYERMRELNAAIRHSYPGCEPYDTSTPAKLPANVAEKEAEVPKQTIQQLARLVMNSARWRHSAPQQQSLARPAVQPVDQRARDVEYNVTFTAPKANAPPPPDEPLGFVKPQKPGSRNEAAFNGGPSENNPRGQSKFPMGFTTTMLIANDQKSATLPRQMNGGPSKALGFVDNPLTDRKNNVRFMDEALVELQKMYIERQNAAMSEALLPFVVSNGDSAISAQNRNLIERYVNDLMTKKSTRDKDTDSDNDDEYLDTTTSMHPTCVVRRGSLTSNGTASTETAHSVKLGKAAANHCRIS